MDIEWGSPMIAIKLTAVVAANATTLELRSFQASVERGSVVQWEDCLAPGLSKTEWLDLLRQNSGTWIDMGKVGGKA